MPKPKEVIVEEKVIVKEEKIEKESSITEVKKDDR